jgi:hypothetical protein
MHLHPDWYAHIHPDDMQRSRDLYVKAVYEGKGFSEPVEARIIEPRTGDILDVT